MANKDRAETCPTITVPEAGKRYFGLTRNASYEAAKRGTIPTIRVGPRTYRVPVRLMEKMLGPVEAKPPLEAKSSMRVQTQNRGAKRKPWFEFCH